MPVPLDYELCIFTLNESVIMLDMIFPFCTISIGDHDPVSNLMALEMRDFKIILGMD